MHSFPFLIFSCGCVYIVYLSTVYRKLWMNSSLYNGLVSGLVCGSGRSNQQQSEMGSGQSEADGTSWS